MELRQHAELSLLGPRVRTPLTRRLLARARHWRLDEALAQGADPSSDPLLTCRAQQLTSRTMRHRLALGLRDLVERAEHPRRPGSAVPIARLSVTSTRDGLLELADRLDGNDSVRARGVATTNLLLTDGASPLWLRSAPRELDDAVEAALIGLAV